MYQSLCDQLSLISIHALREEGDRGVDHLHCILQISIHALREEGDPTLSSSWIKEGTISIHALREEGDTARKDRGPSGNAFQSTPSARRATMAASMCAISGLISIHALREEGDRFS